MNGRQCNLCKETKPADKFERVRRRQDEEFYLRSYCKACRKMQIELRKLNPRPKAEKPTAYPLEGFNGVMQKFLQQREVAA